MTVPAPPQALLAPAFAALTFGRFRGAATALELACPPTRALPLHTRAGGLSLGVLETTIPELSNTSRSRTAYIGEIGDLAAAARAAIELAQVEATSGNAAGARGWLGRAKR